MEEGTKAGQEEENEDDDEVSEEYDPFQQDAEVVRGSYGADTAHSAASEGAGGVEPKHGSRIATQGKAAAMEKAAGQQLGSHPVGLAKSGATLGHPPPPPASHPPPELAKTPPLHLVKSSAPKEKSLPMPPGLGSDLQPMVPLGPGPGPDALLGQQLLPPPPAPGRLEPTMDGMAPAAFGQTGKAIGSSAKSLPMPSAGAGPSDQTDALDPLLLPGQVDTMDATTPFGNVGIVSVPAPPPLPNFVLPAKSPPEGSQPKAGSQAKFGGIPAPPLPQPVALGPAAPPPLAPGGFSAGTIGPAPAGISAMPSVMWQAHKSPDGVDYFYCQATGESRWVRPSGPCDVVIASGMPPAAPVAKPRAPTNVKAKLGEPESWETIGRTGWLRVDTENGFQYFYHKKTKRTSWTCPPEIAKEVAALDGALGADMGGSSGGATASADAKNNAAGGGGGGVAQDGQAASADADGSDAEQEPLATKAGGQEKRADEEHKAGAQVSKEQKQLLNFKQLLLEKGVKQFDKYEKWMPKLLYDPRFTAIQGQKQRKALFEAIVKQIDAERKKQASTTKRSGRETFREVINKAMQLGLFDRSSADAAHQAIEKRLGDEYGFGTLPKRERDRMIMETYSEMEKQREQEKQAAHVAFRDLVRSKVRVRAGGPPPQWHTMRKVLQEDPSWRRVGSSGECERIFDAVMREVAEAQRNQAKRAKRQRQDEAEVDAARKRRHLSELEEELSSFFAERIRTPLATSFDSVCRLVEQDQKLRDTSEDALRRIWDAHCSSVADERRRALLMVLKDMPVDSVGPDLSFEETMLRALGGTSAKAFAGVPEEVLRSAWEEWHAQLFEEISEVCEKWLQSCEHFRDTENVDPSGGFELDRLLEKLSAADVRFRRLSSRPGEQRRLVVKRLQELQECRGAAAASRGAEDEEE